MAAILSPPRSLLTIMVAKGSLSTSSAITTSGRCVCITGCARGGYDAAYTCDGIIEDTHVETRVWYIRMWEHELGTCTDKIGIHL